MLDINVKANVTFWRAEDPDFKPNTFDDILKAWADKGLISFYKMYGSIKLFYRYLQIKSYLKD